MVQCNPHALFFVLAIGVSLWTPDCLAQEEASTTEGSCDAYDPSTCEAGTEDEDVKTVQDSNCFDEHHKCFDWAQVGECDNNPNYMLYHCKRSCLQCPDQADELARILEEKEKKKRVWTPTELEVAADMGVEQNLENENFRVSAEEASARIKAARELLQNSDFDENLLEICKNQHEDCTTW